MEPPRLPTDDNDALDELGLFVESESVPLNRSLAPQGSALTKPRPRPRRRTDENSLGSSPAGANVSLLTRSMRRDLQPPAVVDRLVPDAEGQDGGSGERAAAMASLTDKAISLRLGSYQGELRSLNLTNATSLQGLFLDSVGIDVDRRALALRPDSLALRATFSFFVRQVPTSIRYLDLTGCRSIKNEYFTSFVSKFFNLESLFLVGCEELRDDAIDAVVTFCPRLEGIAVPPTTTDAGLAALARSASIKRVGIRSCPHVTLDGIRHLLRSKPGLERVVVSKCALVSASQFREEGRHEHDDDYYDDDEERAFGVRKSAGGRVEGGDWRAAVHTAAAPGGDVGDMDDMRCLPAHMTTPAQRRRSLNLEIMKEFVSS